MTELGLALVYAQLPTIHVLPNIHCCRCTKHSQTSTMQCVLKHCGIQLIEIDNEFFVIAVLLAQDIITSNILRTA